MKPMFGPVMRRIVLLGAVSGLSSGCMMYRLEELRNTTPQGSAFQNQLSAMYMDFATKEEKAYDWRDSWYFADKGLRLAYGKEAGPEELDGWDLTDANRMELDKMRIRVMDVLTPALKDKSPTKAAQIQFYFDCWVEQQEENWQEDDIAFCRDNLIHALNDAPAKMPSKMKAAKVTKAAMPATDAEPEVMVNNVMPEKTAATPKTAAKPEKMAAKAAAPAKAEMATETASYAVFFDTGKADVSVPGKNVLNEVVNSVKGKSDYVVVLHVAALPGSSAQGKDLPAKRISVVKKVLVDGGVTESAIIAADGAEAAKPVARRIELFLNE